MKMYLLVELAIDATVLFLLLLADEHMIEFWQTDYYRFLASSFGFVQPVCLC